MGSLDLGSILHLAMILLAAGCVAGLLAGILGVGGGIVVVPALFLLSPALGIAPDLQMHVAVGTSLATIIPTSIMSARAHYQRGALDFSLLKLLGPGIVLGVVAGTLLGSQAKGETLTLTFASIALLVSLHTAFGKKVWLLGETPPQSWRFRLMAGGLIGGISVVMGIGGGTLSVPTLRAYNVPIRKAVGTAAAIGLIIALPGAIGYALAGWGDPRLPAFCIGHVNVLGFALIVPATMVTAPIGARIAHALNPVTLQRMFAVFLCLTALRMFWSVLG